MEKNLERQLRESFYVHKPLRADESRSMEAYAVNKKVLESVPVWDGQSLSGWSFDGDGEHCVEDGCLCLKTWARADHWPESEVRATDAPNGHYATFGSYIASLALDDARLSRMNRLSFELYAECPGLHSPIVRVGFRNNGTVKIPDAYSREGFHAMNLKNHAWNHMSWEIESIAHDKIEEISFNMHRYGKEVSGGDDLCFRIRNIRFERVEQPDVVHGWMCMPETAVLSTAGYAADGAKTAVANTVQPTFSIVDADTGAQVFEGPVQTVNNRGSAFQVLDFSDLCREGTYRLQMGGYTSEPFRIGKDVFTDTASKLVNFLFCERCGYPVPGKHGSCHHDVFAQHNGVKMSYAGGWHDAADVSQQSMQSAEILHAVLELAQSVRTTDPLLYQRLMEEGAWGIDYVLRTRFGDGYRATNSSIRRWTDNLLGNMDDCEVNVHNHSFENFICAGVEAYAAACFAEEDGELAWKCRQAAREDFAFAAERFAQVGLEEPVPDEHAASASISQYYAAACWAAAQLVSAGGCPQAADSVREFARKLMACQQQSEKGVPVPGFFYRDETHKVIVHFSHQARDQIFVQALAAACRALPDDPEKGAWERSMRLYGEYLKKLKAYTQPYGMLPAGVYHVSELDDEESFARVHPHVVLERERANYREQLENATDLGGGWYLRCFPVWFSFRGNSAVHLSMGKAASLLGRYFGDEELTQIAREQLYWTTGKNPFGQSLIYGVGARFGQQYTALLGETVGEMPVGVQTRRNEDVPYWPPANIATYREVWTTPPGRWMWVAADLLQTE